MLRRARLGIACAAALLLLLAVRGSSAANERTDDDPPPEPLRSELEERVRVQLVLIDVVVLDRKDRTVAGLTADDFELFVGGRETAIASLDVNCPLGAAGDVRADQDAATSPLAGLPAEPRRIVMAFDYYHMQNAGRALDAAERALERWSVGGETHMIVSLGGGFRVEQPFTADLDEVRDTLRRMRDDPTLFAGNHDSLTQWPFFRRMETLFDLMERYPGRKVVVLFSGPFLSDGFYHDTVYKRLAAMAATTRTAVYPVDTGGLRTNLDPLLQPFGGPPKLRRLANVTGGRMTAETNDIELAYGRAQRDSGCVYTLGFRDRGSSLDRRRRVSVYVRKHHRGLRAVHPESYVIRSPERRRRSLVRTAGLAPAMFAADGLDVAGVPLRPLGRKSWEMLLAVSVQPPAADDAAPADDWTLRVYLRSESGTLLHAFRRRLPAGGRAAASEKVTFFERVAVRAGSFVLAAVLAGPGAAEPLAVRDDVELPALPPGKLVMVGPMVGRAVRPGLEQHIARLYRQKTEALPLLDGSDLRLEPLLGEPVSRGGRMAVLTRICRVDSASGVGELELERRLAPADGAHSCRLAPARLELAGNSRVRCATRVDPLFTDELPPGEYRLTAFPRQGPPAASSVAFTVAEADGEGRP